MLDDTADHIAALVARRMRTDTAICAHQIEPIQLRDKLLRNISTQEAGAAWLEALPSLLGQFEAKWNIKVGRLFPNATEAFVSEAITADGQSVALKIPIVGVAKADRERNLLQAAGGRGYARLLRHDAKSGAMLLERLGPQLATLGFPIEDQIRTICRTLQSAWAAPLPPGARYPTGAEKASEMLSYISTAWERLGRPCSERIVEVALRFAEARRGAFDPADSVLGHGDAHAWNTLRDPTTNRYKFVDPDGLFIERAHDLSISMREWSAELLADEPVPLARKRCVLLSRLTGVPENAIWQWAFIERLVNGLRYLEVGPEENAAEFLAVVEAWAEVRTV
jgi:streptomycin 6-kinase